MTIKKFTVLLTFILLSVMIGCGEKEPFVDPAYVFMKWSSAVKNLNYREYSECEAFPKDEIVFRELYMDFYFTDLLIRELGEYKENEVQEDIDGHKYNIRKVYFECLRVQRKTGRAVQRMKGDIEFIKYIDGPKLNRGWLMFNRTIINTGLSIEK